MTLNNKYDYYVSILLCSLVVVLLFTANSLSISYKEALNVFVNFSVLSVLTNLSIYLFGQNDIALRLPFIIFYVLSVWLMFKMTKDYFKHEKDRYIFISIFMILPGLLSASLLVNSAIVVTFFLLLYLYIYQNKKKHSYILLFFCLFVDNSFAVLYLALFFFSLKNRDTKLLIISLVLFTVSMYIYGFATQGKPRGFLADTFAIYASVFSPLLFIYFVYSLYFVGMKKEKTLSWYISTTALLLSLLFSIRQKVYIEDFAPFVIISLPLVLKTFFHSYRVRLKQFRTKYTIAAVVILFMLCINVVITIFNKPLYLVLPKAKKHFVYKYHFVKEIAYELKKRNINYVMSDDKELLLRLRFYNVQEGYKYYITTNKYSRFDDIINFTYQGKLLLTLYIIKL